MQKTINPTWKKKRKEEIAGLHSYVYVRVYNYIYVIVRVRIRDGVNKVHECP